jgi:hypothetical protein
MGTQGTLWATQRSSRFAAVGLLDAVPPYAIAALLRVGNDKLSVASGGTQTAGAADLNPARAIFSSLRISGAANCRRSVPSEIQDSTRRERSATFRPGVGPYSGVRDSGAGSAKSAKYCETVACRRRDRALILIWIAGALLRGGVAVRECAGASTNPVATAWNLPLGITTAIRA